jgi:hypothetical protein
MQGRVAWFIMVHHKPEQLAWLLNTLTDPADTIIIHVDAKSRLGLKRDRRGLMKAVRALTAGRSNVHFLRSRFTNWGGWSLSRTLLDAIALALGLDPDWTHFVNLSGQCYPLKPVDLIKKEMAESGEAVMVEMRSFESLPADDWHLNWHPMLELPPRALKLPGRRRPPRDFALTHKGSQWVVLPRAFCDWVVTANLTRRVAAYLRHLLLSDELIMQTLASNGPFRDRIRPYRRHIVWPGPKTLTMQDLPAIREGNAWFGRKFDLTTDVTILNALAEEIGAIPGPRTVNGGPGGS